MPVYTYRCETCETDFEDYRPISEYADPAVCKCGGHAPRTVALTNTPMAGYARPLRSNAMGINPKQVDQVMRRHPHRVYDRQTGERIFHSHHERSKALKEEGFHDRDGYSGGPPR